MNSLIIKHLNKSFSDIEILKNINLEFEGGNIYGLVGANGSGKSVFLKILAGLITPTNGEIILNGIKLTRDNFPKANIGASIEKPKFINDLSGLDNLKYLADFQKIIGEDKIIEWLKTFDLYEYRNKHVGKYSLGMKQKLSIIQAIMENQKIILLDEVSNNLDQSSKQKLKDILINLKNNGCIVIYVNHDINEVYEFSDKIYKIDNKEIILC